MVQSSISQQVTRIAIPVTEDSGLDLVEVEYKKEGKNWVLRIFIDKPSGVSLDDCQKVSRCIEDVIEVEKLIPQKYTLEVSSPGLGRALKKEQDFIRNKGRKIRLTTFFPVDNQKTFSGRIENVFAGQLHISTKKRDLTIALEKIATAKLEIEF